MWDFKLGFTPNFWLHPLLNWWFARFTTLLALNLGIPPFVFWQQQRLWQSLYLLVIFGNLFFWNNNLSKWGFFSKFQTRSEDVMKLVVSFKRDFSSLRSVEITTTIFCLSELSWEPWLDKKSEIDIGFLSNWTSVQQSSWGCNMSIRFICCCCTRAHSRQIIID